MSVAIDFAGRHVVVTGAAGALGSAVIDVLLAAGAVCHVPLRGDAARLRSDDRVIPAPGVDLTDEAAVVAFYAAGPPPWASIHLAGGFAAAAAVDTSLGDLRAELDRNLVTAFLCSREAARAMRARAPGAGGRIVNVSSRAALEPAGGAIAYTIAKAGVATLTRALAKELGPAGIAVNAVVPSIFDTAANRAAMPGADHARWPKPAEIAATIAWLASPQQTLTSGALVPVYGHA
jgi:NAD(P)-dependent dehydrogenase (short-subunit alcohol dehydrogenase family)